MSLRIRDARSSDGRWNDPWLKRIVFVAVVVVELVVVVGLGNVSTVRAATPPAIKKKRKKKEQFRRIGSNTQFKHVLNEQCNNIAHILSWAYS